MGGGSIFRKDSSRAGEFDKHDLTCVHNGERDLSFYNIAHALELALTDDRASPQSESSDGSVDRSSS